MEIELGIMDNNEPMKEDREEEEKIMMQLVSGKNFAKVETKTIPKVLT